MSSTLKYERIPFPQMDNRTNSDYSAEINAIAEQLMVYPRMPPVNDARFPPALENYQELVYKLYRLTCIARADPVAMARAAASATPTTTFAETAMPALSALAATPVFRQPSGSATSSIVQRAALALEEAESARGQGELIRQQDANIQRQAAVIKRQNVSLEKLMKRVKDLEAKESDWQIV